MELIEVGVRMEMGSIGERGAGGLGLGLCGELVWVSTCLGVGLRYCICFGHLYLLLTVFISRSRVVYACLVRLVSKCVVSAVSLGMSVGLLADL